MDLRAQTLDFPTTHFLLSVNKLVCPALKLGENINVQTLKGTNQPGTMNASFGNLNYNRLII